MAALNGDRISRLVDDLAWSTDPTAMRALFDDTSKLHEAGQFGVFVSAALLAAMCHVRTVKADITPTSINAAFSQRNKSSAFASCIKSTVVCLVRPIDVVL